MTITHALLLEAGFVAFGFAALWLSFLIRDRRQHVWMARLAAANQLTVPDLPTPQQDVVTVSLYQHAADFSGLPLEVAPRSL